MILERELEQIFQEGVRLAHAERELELERRPVVHQIDRKDGDRLALHGLDPTGEGAEHRGDVELAVQHPLHHVPGLVLRNEIAVVGLQLQLDVVDDAALGERRANARGLEHADRQILELGIVEVLDLDALVAAVNEHIGRLVNREGGEQAAVGRRHVEHHVAHMLIEGCAGQAALDEGLPVIIEPRAHGIGQELRQLVLEAFALHVGKGHVARVGADIQDPELLVFVGCLGGRADGDVLARRQLVEELALVSLNGLFFGGGRRLGGKAESGKA